MLKSFTVADMRKTLEGMPDSMPMFVGDPSVAKSYDITVVQEGMITLPTDKDEDPIPTSSIVIVIFNPKPVEI